MSEPAIVFEDYDHLGDWRVEKLADDGSYGVKTFTGPHARAAAVRYAVQRYGTTFVEKRAAPYRSASAPR
jgi:hypothetical protein